MVTFNSFTDCVTNQLQVRLQYAEFVKYSSYIPNYVYVQINRSDFLGFVSDEAIYSVNGVKVYSQYDLKELGVDVEADMVTFNSFTDCVTNQLQVRL
eukprot:CAMPEP_0168348760 /NCGR_PEP_ID=MMETSP0213-20121227/19968_1 /TAXON_ID=151035 /ORGANISM="Euplotes harpa, Strain FSP1.4" /LENGTH=96 /DNA_ID=CAMNT_0008358483 /DNA_START=436 /DNA_END=723 /DNA_ORIENTATION=-